MLLIFSKNVFSQCDGSSIQCLGTQSYTVDPAPVDGHYNSGTVVTFCYTMTNYNQCNSNWFHDLNLSFGPGWDTSTLTAISVPTGCDGQGNWALYSSSTSTNTGLTFGPCFSYDSPLGNPLFTLDGIPGNNYGDNCTNYVWTFCFSIQVAIGCNNQSLSVYATAIGDGTGGSWSSNTCPGDTFNMCNAYCNACKLHFTSNVTNPSCLNNDGVISLAIDSSSGPVHFTWQPNGDTTSSLSGLSQGIYTVSVKDSAGCDIRDTFNLSYDNPVQLHDTSTNASCYSYCNGTIFLTVNGGALPYTYNWSNGNTTTFDTTLCAGTYYFTVSDANFCSRSDTITITQPAFFNGAFSYSPQLICEGDTVYFTDLSSGSIEGYLWVFDDGGYSTVPSSVSHYYSQPGTYTVTLKVQS
ncbi:MAG: PKD domain-containing protein, partial [Chitinophagales bacterium]